MQVAIRIPLFQVSWDFCTPFHPTIQNVSLQSKRHTVQSSVQILNTLPSFEDSADFATAIIFVDGVWSWQTWCKKFMDFPIRRTWTKKDIFFSSDLQIRKKNPPNQKAIHNHQDSRIFCHPCVLLASQSQPQQSRTSALTQKGFKHKLLFPPWDLLKKKVYQLDNGKEKQSYSLPQQTIIKFLRGLFIVKFGLYFLNGNLNSSIGQTNHQKINFLIPTFFDCSIVIKEGIIDFLKVYLSCHNRSVLTVGSEATKNCRLK